MKGLLCVLLALPAGKYSLLCTLCFVSLHHWSSSAVTVHSVFCVFTPLVFFCSYCTLCVLRRQTICLLLKLLCTLCFASSNYLSSSAVKPLVFFSGYCALCVLCRQTICLLLQLLCTLCFVSSNHWSSSTVTVYFVCYV